MKSRIILKAANLLGMWGKFYEFFFMLLAGQNCGIFLYEHGLEIMVIFSDIWKVCLK